VIIPIENRRRGSGIGTASSSQPKGEKRDRQQPHPTEEKEKRRKRSGHPEYQGGASPQEQPKGNLLESELQEEGPHETTL
jgi:hypothetical protein